VEEVGLTQIFSEFCDPKEQPLIVMEMILQPESRLLSEFGLSLVPEKIITQKRQVDSNL